MRRLAVVMFLWSQFAAADDPRAISREQHSEELLHGHIAVRLLRGSLVERDRVVFDWGTARLYVKAFERDVHAGSGFRAAIADDLAREGIDARVAPLRVARPLVGYEVVPRRRPGADDLIYGAYLAGPDGNVDLLAFYVDFGGLDDLAAWTAVARDLAASASWPEHVRVGIGAMTIEIPRSGQHDASTIEVRGRGRCALTAGVEPGLLPSGAELVAGRMLGQRAYWWVGGDHAVTFVDGLRVECAAADARGLAYMMYLAQTLEK